MHENSVFASGDGVAERESARCNVFLMLQISWIRRKDYHLLTVGLTTYSSDDRYQAVHAQHSEVSLITYSFSERAT
jgi:uncharacterized protein YegL